MHNSSISMGIAHIGRSDSILQGAVQHRRGRHYRI